MPVSGKIQIRFKKYIYYIAIYLCTFSHVLFLFKDEHVVIKKLLQFFITEIDAHLLEAIVVENFKASNIQYSNKANPGK